MCRGEVATFGTTSKETSPYLSQPSYSTTLAPLERDGEPQSVVINHELCQKPEFRHVLFGRLTDREERKLHWACVQYWAVIWLGVVAHVKGYIGTWLLYPLVVLCCLRHCVNGHHCCHLKKPLPFPFRLTGFGLFCAGFMPIAATFGDVEHQHMTVHHPQTKGVIDTDDNDPHSRLSRMSLFRMVVTCFINPGHVCMEDVFFHQLLKNPASYWPERVATNLLHWGQLYLLYQMVGQSTFWKILMAGHISMFVLWLFFNGLLHHVEFHRFLIAVDPSGLRRIHPLVDGLFYLISADAWLEIKWHDIHHAMHIANSTFGAQMARGMTYTQIEMACADLVDQGLYLDQVTKQPVSPLAEVGHKVGSRQAYLKAQQEQHSKTE